MTYAERSEVKQKAHESECADQGKPEHALIASGRVVFEAAQASAWRLSRFLGVSLGVVRRCDLATRVTSTSNGFSRLAPFETAVGDTAGHYLQVVAIDRHDCRFGAVILICVVLHRNYRPVRGAGSYQTTSAK